MCKMSYLAWISEREAMLRCLFVKLEETMLN
jgi:hypothetical protein